MLKGADISKWQGYDFNIDPHDFIIMKATEGMTYTDPTFSHNVDRCIVADKLIGAYHYARPENNTPVEEAYNFLRVVKPYIGNILLALDWEGEALNHDIAWALEWMNIVYSETGVRPVLYCSESQIKKFGVIASQNYGLWVAKWSDDEPKVEPWKFWALWQYTSKPYDKDYFAGTREQFLAYCKSNKEHGITCAGCEAIECLKRYADNIELLAHNLRTELDAIMAKKGV